MDPWNHCAPEKKKKKKPHLKKNPNLIELLHQVASPLTKLHVAYSNADWIWSNRNMNPVPPQSYADTKYIHKQNPPP